MPSAVSDVNARSGCAAKDTAAIDAQLAVAQLSVRITTMLGFFGCCAATGPLAIVMATSDASGPSQFVGYCVNRSR